MRKWQVQEAKSKFSEFMEKTLQEGPQVVTRYGENLTVMISFEAYREKFEPKRTIVDLLLNGPKGDDIDIERSKDLGRQEELFDE